MLKINNLLSKISGNDYKNEYNELSNIKTAEDYVKFQKNYTQKIIIHSLKNVKYYRNIKNNTNINLKNEFWTLEKFPLINKEIIRNNFSELCSIDAKNRKIFKNSSGGSTGEPLRFIQDQSYNRWGNSRNFYYYNDILNINESDVKKVVLWGSERDLFKSTMNIRPRFIDWTKNRKILNSFKMTEENMEKYVKTINSFKPDILRGYAGSLFELARYVKKTKKTIYTPKIIISAAETLRDEMRNNIENSFGTKVYNFYGSREVSSIAGECENGLLHVFPGNVVEILDKDNKKVRINEEGKIVISGLFNYSMPFIRYEIGDMAILGSKKCKCGNPLPTLKQVTGRITDHFRLKNGTVIPAEFFIHLIGVMENKNKIKRFQVIQEDYDVIRIHAILNQDNIQSELFDIERKIKLVMGADCKIIWDFVEEIPTSKSGKYVYTRSLVGDY